MAKGEGGFYSCYFKNEYGEAVSSGWVEVMESLPVHQKMHDKHHHEDEEDVDSGGHTASNNSVLLLSTVIGAVVGLLLAALALIFCTKYQVLNLLSPRVGVTKKLYKPQIKTFCSYCPSHDLTND